MEMKRERLNMLPALSRQGGLRFTLFGDPVDQRRLIQFMDRLVRTSSRRVFLILDDLKVHNGKGHSLAGQAPGQNRAVLSAALRPRERSGRISWARSEILAACLGLNAISAIKPLPLCGPCNILLIKTPLSFYSDRISYVLIREHDYGMKVMDERKMTLNRGRPKS